MNTQPDSLPLRDIHLPDPVSWWPPAPGWWALPIVVLGVVVLAWILRRRYQRRALQREADQALAAIEQSYRQSPDDGALAQALSVLLRRISISRYPRADVAGLTGAAWLAWLDRPLAGNDFKQGPGRVLIESPYNPHVRVDADALLQLCQRWIGGAVQTKGQRP